VVAGDDPADLERVAEALARVGIEFQVEERLADPESPGSWSWRILIRPEDLRRSRGVLEELVGTSPAHPAGAGAPGPFYHPGGYDLLRTILVLGCIGLAVYLLVASA
jgi:hypothetical protein